MAAADIDGPGIPARIRVLIVDDEAVVRAGLGRLLSSVGDIELVGSASGGWQGVEYAVARDADVVLMDLSMPDLDGIRATRELRRRAPNAHVVILTGSADGARVRDAVDAGAIGYLLKDDEPAVLVHGIRVAARGESPIAPKVAGHLLAPDGASAPADRLTAREREILALVAQGDSNKAIAHRLGIAEKTVKVHVGSILHALGVTNRSEAALWARRHGIGDHGI